MKKGKDDLVRLLYLDGDILLCPNCGGRHMHHTKVEIFDNTGGSLITGDAQGIFVRVETSGGKYQPIGEREDLAPLAESLGSAIDSELLSEQNRQAIDGISIYFFCEDCTVVSKVNMVQYERATLVESEKTDEHHPWALETFFDPIETHQRIINLWHSRFR